MNLEKWGSGHEGPGAAHAVSWFRALAPSMMAGALLGVIARFQGAPRLAFAVTILVSAAIGGALHVLNHAGAHGVTVQRIAQRTRALRDLSTAMQFMLIAFVVTSIFALELQFDVVPNRYGFVELIIPVAVASILFDVLGGTFCAALTICYAFQALAPPRFAPILEADVSWRVSLVTFAAAALSTAIFFAHESRRLQPASERQIDSAWRAASHLLEDMATSLQRSFARMKTHVLPGAALVLLYAVVWAAFATISTGRGLHGDSLEAYAWGREFVFGYYKHPPFWSWVAGAWFWVMPRTNFSFWLLSELNGALGLAGAWALIGRFGDRRMQMLGVLLLMLTPFYQFNAQRFNANTILLSLWPWTLYFFVRSVETRLVRHAALCGLLAGFAILSKYFGAILIATCFFAALTHESRRRYFTSAAPYVSVLMAFIVFLPHLVWLFRDGFQPLLYLSNRIDVADRAISNHYFEFILGNLAFFVLPAAVLLFARWRRGREVEPLRIAGRHGAPFFSVLAFAPFVLTLVAGTVGHASLGIPFAVPIFALAPLVLIQFITPDLKASLRATRTAVAVVLAGCALTAPVLPYLYLRFDTKHHSEPREEMADAAIALWRKEVGAPLRFIAGERDFQLATVFRSRDNTSEFNNFNFRWSPWVTPEGLRLHGLMAICRAGNDTCNERAARFTRPDTSLHPITLQREVWGAKGLPWTLNLYIIPPEATPARQD
ncbi:MAG: hypothetical protein JWN07_737 [Hyphomicrobiales bacterium]|nr:hypothetical protein [Hyphomicrobiales bacterium]